MNETLVFWTHDTWVPYADISVVDVRHIGNFEEAIEGLKDPFVRLKYNRIIVSSFSEMRSSFGLKATGELFQKLFEVESLYDYTIIILPHFNEIKPYLKN